MQDDLQRAPRFPWGDFPDVLRNGNLGELKQQPEYTVAKAGGDQAALDLVARVLRPEFIDSVRHLGLMHERPVLLPVLAAETSGNIRIPLMLAHAVAHRLDWPVEERVVQITRAWHTDSGADHRLVVHPEFAGPADSAAGYIFIKARIDASLESLLASASPGSACSGLSAARQGLPRGCIGRRSCPDGSSFRSFRCVEPPATACQLRLSFR